MIEYSAQVNAMCPDHKSDPSTVPRPSPKRASGSRRIKLRISAATPMVWAGVLPAGNFKLSLNIKNGIIEEAPSLGTIGCSGMTHSAAMAGEILPGKTILEALNTDLVCDAINVAMRELFLQIVYGRSQTAFSENGLPVGAGLDDLGKGLRSMTGTIFSTKAKGRPLSGADRGLHPQDRSGQGQPGHRLSVRPSGQDDGGHPSRQGPEGSLREEHRHLRPLLCRAGRCQVHRPAWKNKRGRNIDYGNF